MGKARLDSAVLMKIYKRYLIISLLGLFCASASADGVMDWFLTPDQQGRFYFERGEYQTAARSFIDPQWKAIAFYRAGDYTNAAALFETMKTAQGYFHLGNSLARQEKLAAAVTAYNQALELQPDFPQAVFNLDWVDGLLKLSEKEYDDAGGTDGKLKADRIVVNERASSATGEINQQQVQAQTGLSDQQLQEMWMRRVQTTPGDFLRFKFAYQLNNRQAQTSIEPEDSP